MLNEILKKTYLRLTKEDWKTLNTLHKEIFGREVCLSCRGEMIGMRIALLKHFKMTDYQLKKPFGIYKINKKDSKEGTISNASMTNEKAERFLSLRPERIDLFSKYPEDWNEEKTGDQTVVEDTDPTFAELMKVPFPELKEQYPSIEETNKPKFVKQVLESKK